VASSPAVFDRLLGLETEYAIRFAGDDPAAERPSNRKLFQSLLQAVRERLPTAEATTDPQRRYTANGGCIYFETARLSGGWGLVEGATPECRGPLQAVLYQRAQDQLLSQAAAAADPLGRLVLLKNDRDSQNNAYGAQENYEATMASGWRLVLWRAGLVALIPVVILAWLSIWMILFVTVLMLLMYFVGAGLVFMVVAPLVKGRHRLAQMLFRDLTRADEDGLPRWIEWVLTTLCLAAATPLAVAMMLLVRVCCFVELRRKLMPFLVSRAVIGGAGSMVGPDQFQLADKAPAINCWLGFGRLYHDHPVFSFGHFFKAAFIPSVWPLPKSYFTLFRPRQRLQILLGDSNMAQVAEYLRVGTTLLVIDMIEAGAVAKVPPVRRPLRALQTICADPTLRVAVPLRGGQSATALQLQQYYLNAARRFLQDRPDAPAEAHRTLATWEQTLQRLESDRASLVGAIDWVTKEYLLTEAGAAAPADARKKIDLRYHELSREGYFARLDEADLTTRLVTPDEIEIAIRTPPADSPATMRGHYIREFFQGGEHLAVNWESVILGQGVKARVVKLARFARRTPPRELLEDQNDAE
jgi:proteasome accessory factor A